MRSTELGCFRPQNGGEWALLSALAIWLPGQLAIWIMPVWDPLAPTWASWLAHVVRDIGALAATTIAIATGVGELRSRGFSMRRLVIATLGLAAAVGLLTVSAYGYRGLTRVDECRSNMTNYDRQTETLIYDTNAPMAKRAELSKQYAGLRFVEDGIVVQQVNVNGQVVEYAPTAEDRTNRVERVRGLQKISWGVSSLRRASFLWAGTLVAGLVLGMVVPARRKSATTQRA